MFSRPCPELPYVVHVRPLVAVAVGCDRYPVGYSPPTGGQSDPLLVKSVPVRMLLWSALVGVMQAVRQQTALPVPSSDWNHSREDRNDNRVVLRFLRPF
jgi:hypothetical protein